MIAENLQCTEATVRTQVNRSRPGPVNTMLLVRYDPHELPLPLGSPQKKMPLDLCARPTLPHHLLPLMLYTTQADPACSSQLRTSPCTPPPQHMLVVKASSAGKGLGP